MTTISWTNAAGGDWTTASDWNPATVPTSTDDVFITLPGFYIITIEPSEIASAAFITLNDSAAILETYGTIDLSGTLTLDAGALVLEGGTIVGGTINDMDGGLEPQNGHLVGVTYQGTLDPGDITNGALYIDNGITLQGSRGAGSATINLNGFYDSLLIDSTTTLDNATINFGMLYGIFDTLVNNDTTDSGQTLTLGPNLSIVEQGDAILEAGTNSSGAVFNQGSIGVYGTGYNPFSMFPVSFIIDGNNFSNQGLITVDNYGQLNIGTTTFVNTGSFTVLSGGVDIESSVISLGAIAVDGGSGLTVQGNVTTAQLAGVDLSGGGGFELAGTLNNAGATLDIGDPKLDLLVVRGAITGGIVNIGSSGDLFVSGTVDAAVSDNGTVETNFGDLLLQQTVTGSGSLVIDVTSTLELAAPTAVETDFNPDATLKIDTAANYTGIINAFTVTDTIDLANLNVSSATINAGDTLVATIAGGGTQTYTLTGDFAGESVETGPDDGAGTDLILQEAACYAEGTRIRTPGGETLVEHLRPGDLVLTASGTPRPITWIGRRRIDIARHPSPDLVRPIRIAPHAFGPDAPHSALRLSPDHTVLMDGHLVPIRLLVNGATIAYETACPAVTYFHVELETHDILLAENLPAESYLDTGNRSMFEGPAAVPRPDFTNNQTRREAESCRPFLDNPVRIEPLWRALADRAATLGHTPPNTETTTDPALRIRIGARTIAPVRTHAGTHVFLLPAGGNARLLSRAASPCDTRPWIEDRRRLGVLVQRITLRRGATSHAMPLDHPGMTEGWWCPEGGGNELWRWTDGDAALALPDGPLTLEVTLGEGALYPLEWPVAA